METSCALNIVWAPDARRWDLLSLSSNKRLDRIVEKKNWNPYYSADMVAVIAAGGFR